MIDTDRMLWLVLFLNMSLYIAYIVYLCVTIKSEIYKIEYEIKYEIKDRLKELVDRKDR